jgi:hypothetical protein
MNHDNNQDEITGVNFLEKLTENDLIKIKKLAKDNASEMYRASTSLNSYNYFLKNLDQILYAEDEAINDTQVMKAQVLVNLFFKEVKLIQFSFANRAVNPINITLACEVKSSVKLEFFLNKQTMNDFFNHTQKYYKNIHPNSVDLVNHKMDMIKNLEQMYWFKHYETVQEDYINQTKELEKIKILTEISKLESVMTDSIQLKEKTTAKLKI